jgi:hypothetical protein
MATYAGAQVSDTDALALRGIVTAPAKPVPTWRPTEFRKFNPSQPRVPGGEHGGEWSKAGAAIKKAVKELADREALGAAGATLSDSVADFSNPDMAAHIDSHATLTFAHDPGWSPSTTEATARVLRLYRTSTYKKIGPYLRDPDNAESTMTIRDTYDAPASTESLGTHVAHIDQAMEASPLQYPVVLWRGVTDEEKVFGQELRPDMTGATWTEDSFISTSADRSIGAIFSGEVLMRLHVPAGVGAIQLQSWRGPYPHHNREAELLLDRNLRMRVIGDHEEQHGTYETMPIQPDGTVKRVVKPIIHRVLDVTVEKIPDDEG